MKSVPPPRFEGSVALEDGRDLGFAEFGPSGGRALIWLHGTPGARRQVSPSAAEAAHERGVRIISVERPGIGSSTPHLYEAIRDFALDVEQLCDGLEIERFAIAGLSGGGPYALACAHHMPRRVVAAGLLGGVAPAVGVDRVDGGVSTLTRTVSPVFARTHAPMGAFMRRLVQLLDPLSEQAINAFASFMPPGDQRVFAEPAIREMFTEDLKRGSRHYMQALFLDAVLFGRHWGFELGAIQSPVHMWYGDSDNIVPLEHGEHMAKRIPRSFFKVRPEEGHLGGLGASYEILDALLSEWE